RVSAAEAAALRTPRRHGKSRPASDLDGRRFGFLAADSRPTHSPLTMAALEPSRLGNWASTTPEDAASWFSSLTVPWWIAGGWALHLFLGRQFREHGDFDVGVLRRDFPQLRAALSNWEVFEAQNNRLSLLSDGMAPRQDVNSLWCRPHGSLL